MIYAIDQFKGIIQDTDAKSILTGSIANNVRGPKVGIALRSSVFFWPRSLPSTPSKLRRGDII